MPWRSPWYTERHSYVSYATPHCNRLETPHCVWRLSAPGGIAIVSLGVFFLGRRRLGAVRCRGVVADDKPAAIRAEGGFAASLPHVQQHVGRLGLGLAVFGP